MSDSEANIPLRRGWTTGACAAAAAKAAWSALCGHGFPDPVTITLPGGQQPAFALALHEAAEHHARAAIIKDAGDDPDVTHGCLVIATVRRGPAGSGVRFLAGEGVGTITKPGLPLAVGEPAINPAPRAMIIRALADISPAPDAVVEIGIENGEQIARRTLNGRLGIVGGLSVLGTTGIVVPYSCAAWIASIHRGVDVARAMGLTHLAGSTGDTSEQAVKRHYGLPDEALIDMGDFVGGLVKYLAQHPVPRLTIAGGPAKLTKLAQGMLDLHSKRGAVDLSLLASEAARLGATPERVDAIAQANSALEAFQLADGLGLAETIAQKAAQRVAKLVSGVSVDVLMVGRDGAIMATTAPMPSP